MSQVFRLPPHPFPSPSGKGWPKAGVFPRSEGPVTENYDSTVTHRSVMPKLGMGVVGVGTMGRQHAENIRRLIPEAELIAVADADLKRAAQVASELELDHHYASVEALVER